MFKLQKMKDKEKNLKEARERHLTYRRARIRITLDFSLEIVEARRE